MNVYANQSIDTPGTDKTELYYTLNVTILKKLIVEFYYYK